jgi:asparagine synthase (glutamine-hydrolysing)
MCGIAGFLSFNQNFSKPDLENITNALIHRGPDAAGFYYNNIIGLGHRRLSIIDLSNAANQPMFSHCGRYVIIFNGEIYNFREIAKDLDVALKTTSDTEVLIESFVKWGVDFVNKLNGMFAFTIYDTKEELLYVYRDRMGIKPIYYYHSKNDFVFASELKSFNHLPSIDKGGLNKTALNEFLYLGYIPAPLSIYNNIKKFPSGCYAVIGKNKFEIKTYWKLEEQVEEKVITNVQEAKSKLEALLLSAVQYRMISDVPFGTFLSGGIDSSLVTALAQKLSDKPVKTFSIGFKEGKFNEANHARAVAEYLKTEHHEKVLSYNDALDLLDTVFDAYDEPFADSSAFPTLLVSKFAREHVTVILSGDGGDETYLGYGSYEWNKRLNNPLINTLRKPIGTLLSMGDNRAKRAAQLFQYPNKKRINSHIFSQEQYCFSENELQNILNPEFKAALAFDEHITTSRRKLSTIEEQALFDMKYYLQDDLLVKVDRASMQHSLEVRVPLIDYRLVHFALNLSEDLRKQQGISKFLLKEVLYDLVPKQLFDRPKWGFGIPLGEWLQKDWKFLIDKYLNKSAIESVGIFNYQSVNQLVQRFFKGETYLYNRIWLIIIIQKINSKIND